MIRSFAYMVELYWASDINVKAYLTTLYQVFLSHLSRPYLSHTSLSLTSVSHTHTSLSRLTDLYQEEFVSTSSAVTCEPLGGKCVYQFGAAKAAYESVYDSIPTHVINDLVSATTMVGSNPVSMLFDKNFVAWYNSYMYCKNHFLQGEVEIVQDSNGCTSSNPNAYTDGRFVMAAGMWGSEQIVSGLDREFQLDSFNEAVVNNASALIKENEYIYRACNFSHLLFEIFRESTDFTDDYVIAFLNEKKEPEMTNTFVKGDWIDLAHAQFGSGAITYALATVRSIKQIVRDGMWYFGPTNFYEQNIEFSSWAILQGYPYSFLRSIPDSKLLLEALANRDEFGLQFRLDIVDSATTYEGNGQDFINGVGAIGDRAFTLKNFNARFICDGIYSSICDVLDDTLTSSAAQCQYINQEYSDCLYQQLLGSAFVVNCEIFESSISDPTDGIQCDENSIFGSPHPVILKRGSVLYNMLYSLTFSLVIKSGLWCNSFYDCGFTDGGMFIDTTARNLLFEGVSDPTYFKYYNMKLLTKNIQFYCVEDPTDICGKPRFNCNEKGVYISLPGVAEPFKMAFNDTPADYFFAPYLEIASTGEMLWEHSINPEAVARAAVVKANQSIEWITQIVNPHYALYPTWNNDHELNKHMVGTILLSLFFVCCIKKYTYLHSFECMFAYLFLLFFFFFFFFFFSWSNMIHVHTHKHTHKHTHSNAKCERMEGCRVYSIIAFEVGRLDERC
jgi:hypothetical protein